MDSTPRRSWLKQSDTQWKTHIQRGHQGQIDFLGAVANPYQLTITGPSAPPSSTHPTFRWAKNEFARFIKDIPL